MINHLGVHGLHHLCVYIYIYTHNMVDLRMVDPIPLRTFNNTNNLWDTLKEHVFWHWPVVWLIFPECFTKPPCVSTLRDQELKLLHPKWHGSLETSALVRCGTRGADGIDSYYMWHMCDVHLVVSWNRGTPQIIHSNGICRYKPTIFGQHHLWNLHLFAQFTLTLFRTHPHTHTCPGFWNCPSLSPLALIHRSKARWKRPLS